MSDLFGLPAFRDPTDPATVYVFSENPLRWPAPSSEWLPLYEPDLLSFKVRFRAQDIPPRAFVTVFDLGGGEPDVERGRLAVDWRLHWYRDPGTAWWDR